MAFLKAFGSYLPSRRVGNAEIAERTGCDADWILGASGIEERRFADESETVADLAVAAGEDCLARGEIAVSEIGAIIVASGTSERRFPGPASVVALRLGAAGIPAIDLPMASAGSLFAIALGAQLAAAYANVLVIAAEKMSSIATREPLDRNIAILFGDGAGACLISRNSGLAEIADAVLHSDGTYAGDLKLEFENPLEMKGRSVIMQATRKIPSVIKEVLARQHRKASEVAVFLMHQANQNLIDRVAQALEVPDDRFYSNIRRYGNTSSASMLIAAAEWAQAGRFESGIPFVFAGFGAGFHWGAILAFGATGS